ncbi:MAG: hypothetical protein HXY34_02585 [Candidatus Thorarchaeota archaeon]|nr:hypothetical protein [Candidatus Thorarchaeota archaeon]
MQQLQNWLQIAAPVLVLECVMMIVVAIGWWYGARRLDFRLHHRAVYSIILIHLLGVSLWMIPQALSALPLVMANPQTYWYVIVHDTLGILTIGMALILVVAFLIRPDLPLRLLRRARPIMIIVLTTWTVTFLFGAAMFVLKLTRLMGT